MLENSEWEFCDIESSGDISLRDAHDNIILNVEVKHHIKSNELKDNVQELWKTIHNFYNDLNKYTLETTLILYTVSTISETNTLFNWNSLTASEKVELLRKASKNNDNEIYKTIKKYYDVIFVDIKRLKNILSKFHIEQNQKNYSQYRDYLKKNAYFKQFIENSKKLAAIDALLSVILSGFKDETSWTISKEDFEKKLKEVSGFAQNLVIRVDDDVEIEIIEEHYKESKFVKKLEDIKLDEIIISYAIDDYAKTLFEVNQRMSFVSEFDYEDKLNTYEKGLIKEYHLIRSAIKVNNTNIIEQSKQFYNQIQQIPKVPFIGKSFDDKTTFFQRGYYHILADTDDDKTKIIHWHLGKK